jgi:DNA adenine methylase
MFPYIGGKHKHVGWLDEIFPRDSYTKFVEVFGGAGWVTVKSKRITNADTRIYNDYNPWIANIYECFRSRLPELREQLHTYPKSNRALYQQFQQDIFGNNQQFTIPNVELAAKYLYLQTQLFSGVTLSIDSPVYFQDTASDGKYGSKYDALLNKLSDEKYITRLQEISHVENIDCIDLIQKWDSPDTFFYVDPPYFNKEFLYVKEFPREKHLELAETLKHSRGRWCLSYYDFPELQEWYPENRYHWHRQSVFRWSSTRGHRKLDERANRNGTEIAIMNYDPVVMTPYQQLFTEVT